MHTVLWQAITAEENLAQSYRIWLEQTTDVELQQFLWQLAEEHEQHAAVLQERLALKP